MVDFSPEYDPQKYSKLGRWAPTVDEGFFVSKEVELVKRLDGGIASFEGYLTVAPDRYSAPESRKHA